MPEVLTPKMTREDLVRRLERLQAQCAELVNLARAMDAQAESKGPQVFTPGMVAERWATSERHVRNLVRDGHLPFFRVGGKLLRIPRAAVEEFERRASAPGDDPAPTRAPDNSSRAHLDPLTRARLNNLRQRFTR